jgi:NAD(P)-dependent dehydrogenase (short-subunit alcohol dehydrogenase family)
MTELAGKIAVVTGAGRGLGRQVAIGLARRGMKVALAARGEAELRETAAAIERDGGTTLIVPTDVADLEAVERLTERVLADFGPPQVVINAAGVFGPIEPIHHSDARRWMETVAVNTLGPYLVCRAFVGGMLASGWGRIVNFSSAAALHTPGPLNSAYGTSKVALNHFTRHLAAELAGSGVTANVIHPGEVQTEMWATIRRESQTAGAAAAPYRAWAEDVANSGGDDPQKAVDLVLELLDDRAAAINGQFLWIADGLQKPLASW